ncbi:hypothetical protein GCM10009853_023410 [Glycomyces scopariae]
MRRALKLLVLLGVGLLMAKPKGDGPDGPDGNGGDVDPLTGRPKDSAERQERLNFQGKNASTEMAEVHDTAKAEAESGRAGDSDGDGQPDVPGTPDTTRRWTDEQLAEMTNLGNIPDKRQVHILDGEWDYDSGELLGGGHAPGSGNPGKTEFPERWTDEQIMDNISDVARNPGSEPAPRPGGGYRVTGVVDGVEIEVLLNRDGTVWSAYPLGGDGVVFN